MYLGVVISGLGYRAQVSAAVAALDRRASDRGAACRIVGEL